MPVMHAVQEKHVATTFFCVVSGRRGDTIGHKLREFADLGYPVPMRKRACHRLGRETGRLTWLAVGAMQK